MGCRVLRPEVDLEVANKLLLLEEAVIVLGVVAGVLVHSINVEEIVLLGLCYVSVGVEDLLVAVLSHLKSRSTLYTRKLEWLHKPI